MKNYVYLTFLLVTVFAYAEIEYSSEEYTKDPWCEDLNITETEILSLIKNGQVLTEKILNEEFEKRPCVVAGKIKVESKMVDFEYNFANYVRVEDKIIGCYHQWKGCSEKKEKMRIEVKNIFGISESIDGYRINCKILKRLDSSTIKRFFLHAEEADGAENRIINEGHWSGCVQEGEIIVNGKLYQFSLELGGIGYINSVDAYGGDHSCYHYGCPELWNPVYSSESINNQTHKSLYSFCQTTGIKESEIRKLNPWINKDATNIPPNAEIIIPKEIGESNGNR